MAPPIVVTAADRAAAIALLQRYNLMQRDGATDNSSAGVDDLVVASARAQQCGQANTPLHLPLTKIDPNIDTTQPKERIVYKQLGDNGLLSTFLVVAESLGRLLTTTRSKYGVAVAETNTFVTLSGSGLYPHSTTATEKGVPVSGDQLARLVEIINPDTNQPMTVSSGANSGQRIIGRARVGSSTSPNSVEVEFGSIPMGADPATATFSAYAWEAGKPSSVNLHYGFRQRLDELDDAAFRRVFR